MSLVYLLVPALPLVLGLALAVPVARRPVLALAPAAALPAFALALAGPDEVVPYSWLLLGSRLGLDETGRAFLLLGAALWTAAGVYARSYLARDRRRHWFWLFLLLSASGYFALVLAQDVATFYLGFALMTFSAYGVVVHEGSTAARRAGRVYVALAVLGEAALLAGLLFVVDAGGLGLGPAPSALAASPARDVAVALLLVGLGVKAGVLPLHVWLPLAHPVAPTPASAVLSGAMIKAGLLGWLRFLPAGQAELPGWGAVCLVVGLATAFLAVAAGVLQRDPKTNLAYSSVSQMGVMLTGLGAGFLEPGAWPEISAALVFYAVHHGLAKGALFLGVGVAAGTSPGGVRGVLVAAGLVVPALAVAGTPLTSGAVAKAALERQVDLLAWRWPEALLPLTAVGTALLLGRFVLLARPRGGGGRTPPAGVWLPWALLVVAVAASAWLLPPLLALEGVEPYAPAPVALAVGLWPLVAAAALLLGARRLRRSWPAVPAGDVLVPLERGLAALRRRFRPSASGPATAVRAAAAERWDAARRETVATAGRLEAALLALPAGGALVLLVSAALLLLLLLGGGR
jgi:formate hydrogenlyase subunit 3/multisubunit Na+/H+ antiporter MnhD subunit